MNNLFSLEGKTALITGGNGGLGLGMAEGIVNQGAAVIITGRDKKKLSEAVSEIKNIGGQAYSLAGDVNDVNDLSKIVENAVTCTGKIDIVINNAGVNVRKQPQDLTDDDWDFVMNTNLRSVFRLSKLMYPHLLQNGGGKIINIGSMYSIFGSDWVAPYSASKGGVIQLTKSLGVAWAKDNIQVNAIIPGWFETDLTSSISVLDKERYDRITTRIPSQKWGTPKDIAGTAIFLSSSASDYVTGTSIIIDGGYSASG
ncbi:MAG TPA: 2-deoxy-D-gluconate 3-dehydrogenase [Dehalococcoidia bacterium]|jgi:2-dehydro-3-deoxy-D-gluconate 5-dehydrogenase|nr:2-deoxy-D-gluconate 3-dehydrogenase [Dehalococcoidia bacterium]